MSKFATIGQMWSAFGLEGDTEYRYQGELKDAFGFYLFRSYPPTLHLDDQECTFRVFDIDGSDFTRIGIQADVRGEIAPRGITRPIDIAISDVHYDHNIHSFVMNGKPISGREALEVAWGMHLAPTFWIRGFPLRVKAVIAQAIRWSVSAFRRTGEWMLQTMFGYKLNAKLETLHRGYAPSQMVIKENSLTVMSLGDSPTFEVFKVKIKTTSGLYWCMIVAGLSLAKAYFSPRFSGIMSNATFSLAWSILLLWIIDKVLPRLILQAVNLAIRLEFGLLWRFATIRKMWVFYL